MALVSKSITPHSIPGASTRAAPDSAGPGRTGRIHNADATHIAPPARLKEKVSALERRREPSRPLEQRGRAEHPFTPMPPAEVMQRAHTTGAEPRRLAGQAASALRNPRGTARRGSYAALHYARSLVEGDEDENSASDRIAFLTPVGDKFRDSEQLARHLWDTEDPDELDELLKDILPPHERRDPRALLDQIRRLDRHALMAWLADVQGLPRRIENQDRQSLREAIEHEIRELESSSAAADTREVSLLRLAHLGEEQPDRQKFVSTCADVAHKEPGTWLELLQSIVRDYPPGASSSEMFKKTVHNLILAVGVEMQAICSFSNESWLKVVNDQLQRIYAVHSLIDNLAELQDQVRRSVQLLSKGSSMAAAA